MSIYDQTEERLCFVNCGLPADQCACYRAALRRINSAILEGMHRDPELDRIIEDGLSDGSLYES